MMIDRDRGRATTTLSRVAVVLAVVAAATLVVPTGGFSSVQADRGMEVAVVPDSSAFLGVDIDVPERGSGGDYGDTAISFVAFCGDGTEGSVTVTTVASKSGGAGEPMLVEWNATAPVDTVVVKNGSGSEVDWVTGIDNATNGTVASNDGVPKDLNGNDICPDGQTLFEKVEAGHFSTASEVRDTGGSGSLSVEVTNRFPQTVDATVTVEDTTEELSSIPSGDSKTAEFGVDCDDSVTVVVDAGGSGVSVHLDRHVCDGDGTVYE